MKTMPGYCSFTRGMAKPQNSTGTISAMSQRKPSTPFDAQKRSISVILRKVEGTFSHVWSPGVSGNHLVRLF